MCKGVDGGEYNKVVYINRMIIHDDNPNQGLFFWGEGYRVRRRVGGEFRAMILIGDRLYHPCSYESSSRFSVLINYHTLSVCNCQIIIAYGMQINQTGTENFLLSKFNKY